jgi:hypothetical protein
MRATWTMLAIIWLFLILGCLCSGSRDRHRTTGDHNWTKACISPGGSQMGAVGSEAVLIDLESGNVLHKVNGHFDDVICLPSGDVLAINSREAIWLNAERRAERASSWGIVGPNSHGRIVVSYRPGRTSSTGNRRFYPTGPMQLATENLVGDPQRSNSIELPPAAFTGLGEGNANLFEVRPIRVLSNDRVLVAAGWPPPLTTPDYVDPTRWGFFTVDLENGVAEPFGPVRTSNVDFHLHSQYIWLASTTDGSVVAQVGGRENRPHLAVIEMRTGRERFSTTLENAREVISLRLNRNGTLLAVGAVPPDGRGGRVDVFDATTRQLLWQMSSAEDGWPYFLDFLPDDSLIVMTEKRLLTRRDGRSGEVRWERRQTSN